MLVYGHEGVLSVEIELPSVRLVAAAQLDPLYNDYSIEHIIALEYPHTREVRVDHPRPKFAALWESPFVIYEDIGNECYDLKTVNDEDIFQIAKVLKLWHNPNAYVFTFFVVVITKKKKKNNKK